MLFAISGGSFYRKLDKNNKLSKISNSGFALFTHLEKKSLEGTLALVYDYHNLRIACLELYLSVKIRSDSEIEAFSKD